MGEDSSSQNSRQTETVVGRTSWDFASEALRVLGPTILLVVVGSIGIYYFFKELDASRNIAEEVRDQLIQESKEEQKDLRASLAAAQSMVVTNTSKMQEMSQQLITNLSTMMELHDDVSSRIRKRQQEAAALQVELSSLQDQMENQRIEFEIERKDFDRQREKFGRDIEIQAKALEKQTRETRKKERYAQEKNSQYMRMEDRARNSATIIGELREKLEGLQSSDGTSADNRSMEDVKIALQSFRSFAKRPNTSLRKLDNLIGHRASVIEKVVSEGGLGYEVWFRTSYGFYGYLEQKADGPRNYLKIVTRNVRHSDSKQQGRRKLNIPRVYMVYATVANVVFEIKDEKGAVQVCDVMIYKDRIKSGPAGEPVIPWNQRILDEKYAEKGGRKVEGFKVLFGELKDFEASTMEKIEAEFGGNEQFESWRNMLDKSGENC